MAFNQVNALEFNQIKAQIKEYLRSQDQFSDYDFEGSSLTVLIDTLAYNTYYINILICLGRSVKKNFCQS